MKCRRRPVLGTKKKIKSSLDTAQKAKRDRFILFPRTHDNVSQQPRNASQPEPSQTSARASSKSLEAVETLCAFPMSGRWGQGLLVSSSGLRNSEREALFSELTEAGAEYEASFSRRCTHLVVLPQPKQPLSLKIAQAIRNRKKWNTQIVSTEWLQDSVRQELAQPEDRYLPESLRQEIERQEAGTASRQDLTNHAKSIPSTSYRTAATALKESSNVTIRATTHRSKRTTLSRFARECSSLHPQHATSFVPSPNSRACCSERATEDPGTRRWTKRTDGGSLAARRGTGTLRQTTEKAAENFTSLAAPAALGTKCAAQQKRQAAKTMERPPLQRAIPGKEDAAGWGGVHVTGSLSRGPAPTSASEDSGRNVAAEELEQDDAGFQDLIDKLRQRKVKPSRVLDTIAGAEATPSGSDLGAASAVAAALSDDSISSEIPFQSFPQQLKSRVGKERETSSGDLGASKYSERGEQFFTAVPPEARIRNCSGPAALTCHSDKDVSEQLIANRNEAQESRNCADVAERLRAWAGAKWQVAQPATIGALEAVPAQTECSPNRCHPVDSIDGCGNLMSNLTSDETARSSAGLPILRAKSGQLLEDESARLAQSSASGQIIESGPDETLVPRARAESPDRAAAVSKSEPAPPGLFDRMVALLDPGLSADDFQRVRDLVVEGGGAVTASRTYLGSKATHVVCYPDTAGTWVTMGANVVSPEWLERSVLTGSRLKTLQISLDTLQHLPQKPSHNQPALGESAAQSLLPHRGHARSHSATIAPRLCPARLLEGVHWAVSQPLECVRMDSQLEQGGDAEEDEAESLSPSQREARLLCERWSAPQAVGRELSSADWDLVVFRRCGLTLLLPQDGSGELGHHSCSMAIPEAGLTRRQLMCEIASFYQGGCRADLVESLGSCVHVESLRRVSRSKAACIYELCLTA